MGTSWSNTSLPNHCNTLQHTATHCTHCNIMQHTAWNVHCVLSVLQCVAMTHIYCNNGAQQQRSEQPLDNCHRGHSTPWRVPGNGVKQDSYAHRDEHGSVLVQGHASWRDGSESASSVAVDPCSQSSAASKYIPLSYTVLSTVWPCVNRDCHFTGLFHV